MFDSLISSTKGRTIIIKDDSHQSPSEENNVGEKA